MAKLVGLSGAQGAGKSTLLKELMNRGWYLDQFRVSRAVQEQFGWGNLERVMDSPWTMMEFQEEVFRQKYNHDHALHGSKEHDVILVERTFADILAYTKCWTEAFTARGAISQAQANVFLSEFARKCTVCQNEVYSGVILLPLMSHVVFELDPNRAAQDTADLVYNDVRTFVFEQMTPRAAKLEITTKTVQERADEASTFLYTLRSE